jgi:hypothetical protein
MDLEDFGMGRLDDKNILDLWQRMLTATTTSSSSWDDVG